MNHTIDAEVIEHWNRTLADQSFLQQRGVRRLFNRVQNIASAFASRPRSVTCVDEGIVEGLHLAGSGVLLTPEQLRTEIAAAKITEFTTHDNCGAFGLAFPHEKNANQACREWGTSEAERLGLPHRHIVAEEMDRPSHLHTASAIYYDATGIFNRIPGLPRGFVVSRGSFGSGPSDLSLCLKIAFGDHGFGDLFTEKNPLTIVLLPHPNDRSLFLSVLEDEARDAAAPYGRRAKIDGFKTAWFTRN